MLRYSVVKRWLDFWLAALLVIPLAPALLCLVAAIGLDSRGCAFYRQRRVGRYGVLFTIYKLRSMTTGAPLLSTEAMRLHNQSPFTRLGPLLRKSNVDELPQIMNILRGEMSFIGPRPALPTQTDVLELRRQLGADQVLPGITGLAQVSGRDDLVTVIKVQHDAEYARQLSAWLDLRILWRTVAAVVSGRGNQ